LIKRGIFELLLFNSEFLMKILVCICPVPDTTTKIAFSDNNTHFSTQGVTFIINPYDEWYALVRALELKESGMATAVALGGDEAVRIDTDSSEPYIVAAQIAEYAKANGYELVLCGKESIDYNNGATGAMIAELLEMNYLGFAARIDIAGTTATVKREIEGGEETDTCELPLVISCQKGVAEARIPNMRGIMAARTKPLKVVPPAATDALTTIVSYELPAPKTGVKMISPDNMDELVNLLHTEAKVI
jgi:electron transfer flavoprotein beta subunit